MKLEAELCILKDTFVTQNKQSEAHMNRLASRIEEMTKQFTSSMNKMAAPQLSGQSQPAYRPAINYGRSTPFRQNINATQSGCFYCGEEGASEKMSALTEPNILIRDGLLWTPRDE